ncbi:hypothetical protein CRYUN_Cryun20dG0042800 [Craigia yunnanensis]
MSIIVVHTNRREPGIYLEPRRANRVTQKVKKAKHAKGESITKEKVVARLQECGPWFTLKLVRLQHGTFDTQGEYEWVHKPEMDTTRRRFSSNFDSCFHLLRSWNATIFC